MGSDYPVRFDVEYPDRELDRLSTGFRIFLALPILILVAVMSSVVTLPLVLMILFRKKYPRWWFDWNLELSRFFNRVGIYMGLMNDEYPSTDDHQTVRLGIDYPDAENDLARGMPLIKWLLAIPHYIVLIFLAIGAVFAVIGAWFAILFTGRYPRGLFDYVVGVHRWFNRVDGYVALLVTDRYPPFSLQP